MGVVITPETGVAITPITRNFLILPKFIFAEMTIITKITRKFEIFLRILGEKLRFFLTFTISAKSRFDTMWPL